MNNAIISQADRFTHLKIVAVSLVASIIVLGVAISARMPASPDAAVQTANGPVVKATKTIVTTTNDTTTIR